ncbi:unnamed protein product [Caenorhabditis sp. 36 PRJEB53466]|nr:unnamed protein product [Caenorhabditis sp. 36 PRJEB53466]
MKYDMSLRKDELSSAPPAPTVKQLLAGFQSKLEDDNRFRKPPPFPRRAPPPPPHRKPPLTPPPSSSSSPAFSDQTFSTDADTPDIPGSLRRSLGPKPKVAPKPLFLNNGSTLLASSSSTDIPSSFRPEVSTPTILVSPVVDKTVGFTNGFAEAAENGNGIRERAKQLENLGFVPRSNSGASQIERPISQVSTLSQVSDEFDDGDTTASEDESMTDEKQLRRHRHEDDFDELPLPRTDRKTTMVATTHSEIMHEMEHLFVKGGNKKGNSQKPQRRQSNIDEIPADVGKLRDNRKGRHNSLFVSPTSGTSTVSDVSDFSRITSMTSDRSSVVTSNSGGGDSADGAIIPDYATGDEEEDKRLKKLHYAAVEFQKVQTNYVQYLKEMAVLYPEYMERFGKRFGRDLLAPTNGHENVVLQIKKIMVQILPLHEMLLKEIDKVCSNWDSRHPNMSNVIAMYADFLKCCQPFLDNKADFLTKLLQLRNEDKEFDEATLMFETEVFKRGKKGAVIQQLDQVHQNFMRYKLLMLRYSEYLVDGSDEKNDAQGAIEKLERMTQAVNQKMGLPTTEELTKLYYRFQCQFNVLEPGRVLIRQADVLKQTRKEEQPRFLILFTDSLWICRVSKGGQFDMNRSYRIPMEHIRADKPESDEYSKALKIQSRVKSAMIIFASEKERDLWLDDIRKAYFDRREYKRRFSKENMRVDVNRAKMKKLKMLAENNIKEEEHQENEERPGALMAFRNSRSTSMSGSQDELSSVPVTPCDTDMCPDFGDEIPVKNGKKKVVDSAKPVWLPDNMSSECLMEGCSTEFNLINRRHHCRDCGWLICKYCKGQAPLSKYDYQKQIVCPECFDKIFATYKDGYLFPMRCVVQQSDGTALVRIGKKDGDQELVDPRKLFKAPFNCGFKKRNVEEKRASSIVFGKIYLRHRKSEVVRHALLRRDDLKLVIYKAELDSKAVLEVLIYGYFYRETRLESPGGWLFELVHRNQIRTDDTKDDVIAFRVDNSASAKKWSAAFADKLEQDPTQVHSE